MGQSLFLTPFTLWYAIAVVIISGFFHALWNVCTKKSLNKQSFLFNVQLVSFVFFAPFCIPKLIAGDFSTHALLLFACSAICHGLYFLLLAKLYTTADLSQSYPIIRGSSLLIIPLFGILFLNETISLLGWVGIAIIIAGIFSISEIKTSRLNNKVLALSLCVGLAIAMYLIIDKLALQYTDPMTLNFIGTVGNLIALFPIIYYNKFKTFKKEWTLNYKAILIGAALAPVSYMLFLWAVDKAPISVLAPIREIGIVFGAMIGIFFLKEPNGKNRIISSIFITLGMVILGLFH